MLLQVAHLLLARNPHPNPIAEIWGRHGGDMGEIWGRYGGDMGEMVPLVAMAESESEVQKVVAHLPGEGVG